MRAVVAGLSLLGAMLAGAGARACALDTRSGARLDGRTLAIAWRAEPAPIPIGRHFNLRIIACTDRQQIFTGSIAVDASMPLHRHGMNYRATVRRDADGSYVAEGLLFHMPGRWRITIDTDDGKTREHLSTELEIE